ncbi:hypothetical protein [Ramlibacter montanisoli]|uniref:hypothetical protein n=1 Tax=Ramlibacter montanisoli TaxID=2732512 RepID=UPI00403A5B1C
MVREGRFRSDLFFRLRIVSIVVPALRARGGDILLLAQHFLAAHGRRCGKPALRFSEEAERALAQYFWPGNVRELRNMLQQTVLLAQGDLVTPCASWPCAPAWRPRRPQAERRTPGAGWPPRLRRGIRWRCRTRIARPSSAPWSAPDGT